MRPNPASEAAPTGAPRRLPWWKVALLAPLPLLALLVLLEGLLWALGLGDPDERLSLERGFSEDARYLLPDPEVPGGWVTQLSDGTWAEKRIPPKDERLRVLMFGGSNTQGFPDEYLQEQLEARAPDPGFEVVNLGRAGYGSERVLILLRQAMELDPDILFIYCGHNEFVEAGFALELVRLWKEPWLTRAVERLTRLRTLNVLTSAFEALRTPVLTADGRKPEGRGPRGEEFQELRYEDTLRFYDVYRFNLDRMLSIAADHDVPVMLCTVVGNMLYPPIVPGEPEGFSPDQRRDLQLRLAPAFARIPERLRLGLIHTSVEQPAVRLDPREWGEALDGKAKERRLAQYEASGKPRFVPVLRPLAPPFDGGPFWTDPALWSDRTEAVLPTVEALHQRQLTDAERAALEESARLLEDVLHDFPQHSLAHYALGLATCALGEDARAVQHLRDAARYDRAPTRGNDVTNGIVRELAREHPDVAFVDAEELVRAACPSGLIGYELLMDNCHLHPDARMPLMDMFVPGLAELGERRTSDGADR